MYDIEIDLSEKSKPDFIPLTQVSFVFVIDVTVHAMLDSKTLRSFVISTGKLSPSIVTRVPPFDEP